MLDLQRATFLNYTRTIPIVQRLFKDIKLSELNDLVVQSNIDEYGDTHSRKTTTEVLLKIRTALRYAYGRGLLSSDFAGLIKTRGNELEKRNKALSISEFKILRSYLLQHHDIEFNILVLLALETGARRGELLGIKSEDVRDNRIYITRSISPTSDDTRLKTKQSKRDIAITKEVFDIVKTVVPKSNGYLFEWDNFKQSEKLKKLLLPLGLTTTTFHGLRDTFASYLFSNEIRMGYISKVLGHSNLQTTMNFYLSLMPEKRHSQEFEALSLLK